MVGFKTADWTECGGTGASGCLTQASAGPTTGPVIWAHLLGGITAAGSALAKTAASASWDDLAYSDQSSAGNMTVSALATDQGSSNTRAFIGLTDSVAGYAGANAYTFFRYGLFADGPQIDIYENGVGVAIAVTSYIPATDVISVVRSGDTVTYKKNGTTFYTSGLSAAGKVLFPASSGYGVVSGQFLASASVTK